MSLAWIVLLIANCSIVLVLCTYLTTLVHVCRGSRYQFVINLVLLLILSNCSELLLSYTNMKIYEYSEPTRVNVWLLGIGIVFYNVPFNVAHFLLGWKYNEIAADIPDILNENPESIPYSEKHRTTYWILLLLNLVLPIV
jgi:hypothetical protein